MTASPNEEQVGHRKTTLWFHSRQNNSATGRRSCPRCNKEPAQTKVQQNKRHIMTLNYLI